MFKENEKYERNNTGKLFLVQASGEIVLGRNVWLTTTLFTCK